MSRPAILAALVVLATFAVSPNAAVKCYSCTYQSFNSAGIDNCKDKFNSDSVPTCDGSACIKQKSDNSNGYTITRSCSNVAVDGCVSTSAGGFNVDTCTCKSDKCNAATRGAFNAASVSTAAGLAIAMAFLAKRAM